jgi:hypothetical protein
MQVYQEAINKTMCYELKGLQATGKKEGETGGR